MNISDSIKTYVKHLYKETNTYDRNDLTVRTTNAVKLARLIAQEPNHYQTMRINAVKSMQRADIKRTIAKICVLIVVLLTTTYLTYLALVWRTPKINALHATNELLKYASDHEMFSMETQFSMQKTVLIDQLNKRMFRDGACFSLIAVAAATLYRLFSPRHEQAILLLNSSGNLNKFYTDVVALANNENEISAIVDEQLKQMKIYF